MTVDNLWFLADRATRNADTVYHRLSQRYGDPLVFEKSRNVSRLRFRTLAERIRSSGGPYGAHTIVYRSEQILLVRHEGVEMWVLPGGQLYSGETFHDAAKRELSEETGIEATYEELAVIVRVDIHHGSYYTWGVLPVFLAEAETVEPDVCDPDDEISTAQWFDLDGLPGDTRDREDLLVWCDRVL